MSISHYYIKLSVFLFITVMLAFLIGNEIAVLSVFNLEMPETYNFLLKYLPIVFLTLLFLVFYGTLSILHEDNNKKILIAFASSITFSLGILHGYKYNFELIFFPQIVSLLLFMLGLMSFNHKVQSLYNNQIKPSYGRISVTSSSEIIFLITVILAGIVYLNAADYQKYEVFKTDIISRLTDQLTGAIETSLKGGSEEILNTKVSVSANPNDFIKNNIMSKISPIFSENLQLNTTEYAVDLSAKDAIGDKINLEEADIKGKLKPLIEKRLVALIDPYAKYIPAIICLYSFFIISTVFVILRLLLPIVFDTFIYILKKLNIIEEKEVTIQTKRVSF